ncbi:hypothetical protein [Acidocella sp.]|uniref:hypothetical protein n=1 Tax=Acidocella sp. TaxID=50710 RepID=UPI0026039400|nr:hypothetical protein [Acidocella sp.]
MSKLLTSAQLSGHPGYPSEWTLARWRRENVGPPYQRIMGRVFYDPAAVEEWERSKRGGGHELPAPRKRGAKSKAKLRGISGMLTVTQLAAIPGFPCESILRRLRRENIGPPFVRIGKCCFYDMAEAARWLESRMKSHAQPEAQMRTPSPERSEDQDGDTPR